MCPPLPHLGEDAATLLMPAEAFALARLTHGKAVDADDEPDAEQDGASCDRC
jgi:hypothetical protein